MAKKEEKSQKAEKGSSDSDIKKRLKQMRENWDKGKEASKKGGFNTVDDGAYITKLTGAEIRSGKNDSMGVLFEWTVTEGDNTGEKITRWSGFETDEKVVYLQRDLRRLGVEVDDFNAEDLPDILEKLVAAAPACRLKVKTNGEFTNVYIDKLLETDDEGGGGDEGGKQDTSGGNTDYEPEKGDRVTFELKGKEKTGTVAKVYTDGTSDVEFDDDQSENLENSLLTKIENEEEKSSKSEKTEKGGKYVPAKGDKVSFEIKGKKKVGKVTKTYDDSTSDVEDSDGDTHNIDDDKLTKLVKTEK